MKLVTLVLTGIFMLGTNANAQKRKKFANRSEAVSYIQESCNKYWAHDPLAEPTGQTVKITQDGCLMNIQETVIFKRAAGYNNVAEGYTETRTTVTNFNLANANLAETYTNVEFLANDNAIKNSTTWSTGLDKHEEFPKVLVLPLDYKSDGIGDDLRNLKEAFRYVIRPCNVNVKGKGKKTNIFTRRS